MQALRIILQGASASNLMEDLQVVFELVNHAATVTPGKDRPRSPDMRIDQLGADCPTALAGVLYLQQNGSMMCSQEESLHY